jgi:hypothetical protein
MGIPSKQACAALGSLALAAGLAGCGETVSTGSYSGESKAVAQRISEFQHDATEASEKNICSRDLSVRLRATSIGASVEACEAALKRQLKQVEDVNLSVKSVSVHGNSATATVKSTWSGKNCLSTMLLEKQPSTAKKEGSAWKISGMQTSCK